MSTEFTEPNNDLSFSDTIEALRNEILYSSMIPKELLLDDGTRSHNVECAIANKRNFERTLKRYGLYIE